MAKDFSELTKKLLCPPGNGVFTVNTAKEKKELLHAKLYPDALDSSAIEASWSEGLKNLKDDQLSILGIPSDCGGGIHRGANWGPLFIRLEVLKSLGDPGAHNDLGDVRVIPHLLHDKYINQQTLKSCRKALYSNEEEPLPVSPLSIAELVSDTYFASFPQSRLFSLGGDHSVSYPIVRSYLRHRKSQGKKIGLIHFDAHTDLLTERLGIDICFGSWTTHILDQLESPDYCVQIGIRSTAKTRGHWENTKGVRQHWSQEVFDKGAGVVAKEIVKDYKEKGVEEIYISFDIDALDATIASATGTPEIGGLKMDQCFIIMRELVSHFKLGGADLMEVAPFLNMPIQGRLNPEPDSTLMAARSLSQFFIDEMSNH